MKINFFPHRYARSMRSILTILATLQHDLAILANKLSKIALNLANLAKLIANLTGKMT